MALRTFWAEAVLAEAAVCEALASFALASVFASLARLLAFEAFFETVSEALAFWASAVDFAFSVFFRAVFLVAEASFFVAVASVEAFFFRLFFVCACAVPNAMIRLKASAMDSIFFI